MTSPRTPTTPGEKYAMVTKEEIHAACEEGMGDLLNVALKALRERDAYRKVAIRFIRLDVAERAYTEKRGYTGQECIDSADAEALKLLTPTEGKS